LRKSRGIRLRQVRLRETSASEPFDEASKGNVEVKTGPLCLVQDKFGGSLLTAQAASGVKVA
jgi:hypothetical protein